MSLLNITLQLYPISVSILFLLFIIFISLFFFHPINGNKLFLSSFTLLLSIFAALLINTHHTINVVTKWTPICSIINKNETFIKFSPSQIYLTEELMEINSGYNEYVSFDTILTISNVLSLTNTFVNIQKYIELNTP